MGCLKMGKNTICSKPILNSKNHRLDKILFLKYIIKINSPYLLFASI